MDGIFYRGKLWFGSAENSLRFRHIRARPQVSATHTRGEELVVTVHGTRHEIDKSSGEYDGFKECLREVYGEDWESWGFWEIGAVRVDRAAGDVRGVVQEATPGSGVDAEDAVEVREVLAGSRSTPPGTPPRRAPATASPCSYADLREERAVPDAGATARPGAAAG